MPFLEKLADITVSGRHVGDMSATFPAKSSRFGIVGVVALPWISDSHCCQCRDVSVEHILNHLG
jgi:hypothetical protein